MLPRPLRVVFVCQWYAPEPVTQPMWIVEGLVEQGLDVTVLTGMPNYPSGRRHGGYPRWRARRDVVDGVEVVRTPLYADHGRRAVPRMLNYVSWALSSAIAGRRVLAEADVVLVYSSPATAALGPWVANRRSGVPYVLQIQDLWPDSVTASGMGTGALGMVVTAFLARMTATFYARAARVVVISPGMKEVLSSRKVAPQKISLVYNWVRASDALREGDTLSDSGPGLRADLSIPPSAFVLMYAGNHGEAQDLGTLVTSMAELRHLSTLRHVHLVMVGDGISKPALIELAHHLALDTIHFVDPVPVEALRRMVPTIDAQVVALADDPLFRVTMPSKVQSILASGVPLVACGRGDVATVVEEADAGIVVDPGDPVALAKGIATLVAKTPGELRTMGENGAAYYEQHMAQAIGGALLADELRAAVRG